MGSVGQLIAAIGMICLVVCGAIVLSPLLLAAMVLKRA